MHGGIRTSNLTKTKLYDKAQTSASSRRLRRWFPRAVSASVITLIPVGASHIYQAAEQGVISWLPYPLFAVFVALVFMVSTRLYSDG